MSGGPADAVFAALADGMAAGTAGKPLRVLTTTYTGSTERSALELLRELGADVRVSYDVSTTRLTRQQNNTEVAPQVGYGLGPLARGGVIPAQDYDMLREAAATGAGSPST